jgi:hypothetical protein
VKHLPDGAYLPINRLEQILLPKNGSSWPLPKKAMSLLNVSTRMHKPAAALSAVFGLRHAYIEGNLFHIQFPLWPETSQGIEV